MKALLHVITVLLFTCSRLDFCLIWRNTVSVKLCFQFQEEGMDGLFITTEKGNLNSRGILQTCLKAASSKYPQETGQQNHFRENHK